LKFIGIHGNKQKQKISANRYKDTLT